MRRAEVGLRAMIVVAVGWIVAAAVALRWPRWTGAAALTIALCGLLTTPPLSEPLFGVDSDQFMTWQLLGVLLGVGLLVVAPREVPLRARLAAASRTRHGRRRARVHRPRRAARVGIYAATDAAQAPLLVVGVGPIALGLQTIAGGLRRR